MIFFLLLQKVKPYQTTGNLMFHGSADAVFMTNNQKIKIVFNRKGIKPGGKAMWLPVRSLIP